MKWQDSVLVTSILFSLICLSGCIFQSGSPSYTIDIKSGTFQPSSITVPMGTTVTWTNHENTNETVTSPGASFSSGDIPAGYDFRFTFLQPGVFSYYSKTNSSMQGVVVVTSPGGSMPSMGNMSGMNAAQPSPSGQNAPAFNPGLNVNVEIKDFSFHPNVTTLVAGTTVTWTNNDSVSHTVTGTSGKFGSDALRQGQKFSYTFSAPGTYDYQCAIHPFMKGRIVVAPSGNPQPSSSELKTSAVNQEQPASVEIKNFAFNPDAVTVPSGTILTWTNNDSVSHTVSSADGKFDSGILGGHKKFSYSFMDPGIYDYHCSIHPSMKAQVIVTPSSGVANTEEANKTEVNQPSASPTEINFEGKTIVPVSTTSPQPSTRVTVDLLAKEMNFDRDNITVIAGSQVNINFVNLDRGVPHNFAVYANSAADTVIFQGQVVIGPGVITYTFDAPVDPGIYFFRCDVHPKVMTGQFIVLPSEGVQPSALQAVTPPESGPRMNMAASNTAPNASAGGATEGSMPITGTVNTNTTKMNANAVSGTGQGPKNIAIDLVAENIAFDKSTITVPAGAHVTVNFNNRDSGVPHTFSVYETAAAQKVIFRGQAVTGLARTKYEFDAPSNPGTYFFRCDIHPTQMTGQFIVTASG